MKYIHPRDIDKNSEYYQVVAPIIKEQAARIIQRNAREKFNFAPAKSYIETLNGDLKLDFLSEPEDDEPAQAIAKAVQNNDFNLIAYQQEDFIRHLLKCLRQKLINKKQFLTTNLLFEALLAFNNNKIPDDYSDQLQKHNFLSGPFDAFAMSYATHETRASLQQTMDASDHYYTINMPHEMTVSLIFQGISVISGAHKTFKQGVENYFSRLPLTILERIEVYKIMLNYTGDLKDADITTLHLIIQKYETDATIYSFATYEGEKTEYYNEASSSMIGLLSQILKVTANMPAIAIATTFSINKLDSPLFSFIIPKIESFNKLQTVYHGNGMITEPQAVIGALTPRLIRAMDELPITNQLPTNDVITFGNELPLANIKQSAAPPVLQALYNEQSTYENAARPVEICHGDLIQTKEPHSYDCYNFMLTWHDLFHCWRNGENNKAMFRHLRQIHDKKANLAVKIDGMSKVIWPLTDIDKSAGEINKNYTANIKNANYINRYNPFSYIWHYLFAVNLTKQINRQYSFEKYASLLQLCESTKLYDFKNNIDDNNIIVFDFLNNENLWSSWFDGLSPIKLLNNAQLINWHDKEYSVNSKILFRRLCHAQAFKQKHKDLTNDEQIFFYILDKQGINVSEKLIYDIRNFGIENLVYWSKNTGLYFKKEYRKYLGEDNKARLSENSTAQLKYCLEQVIYNGAKQSHLNKHLNNSVKDTINYFEDIIGIKLSDGRQGKIFNKTLTLKDASDINKLISTLLSSLEATHANTPSETQYKLLKTVCRDLYKTVLENKDDRYTEQSSHRKLSWLFSLDNNTGHLTSTQQMHLRLIKQAFIKRVETLIKQEPNKNNRQQLLDLVEKDNQNKDFLINHHRSFYQRFHTGDTNAHNSLQKILDDNQIVGNGAKITYHFI